MKRLAFSFLIYFATFPLTAQGGIDNLDSDIICPSSAKAGQNITIDLELENTDSSSSVIVNRSAIMGLWPNGELLGPFTIPLNSTVPPLTQMTLADYLTFPLPSVPISATVVVIGVAVCSQNFNNCNFEECRIEITP